MIYGLGGRIMNIGPLLRNMLGDIKSGEPKALELKSGQVVRGTVLSVSEDGQEAVIQVQGVKLHAALETPLKQGQTTLLQVQPQVQDGLMMLKPINSLPAAPLSPATLASTLEALGLENTPANREMIQMMRESGIPLTKENVNQLVALSSSRPSSVPLGEWIQAAGIALNRGLPVTGETVAGLHQAIFGRPLHALLSSLEEQLGTVLKLLLSNEANSGASAGTSNQGASAALTGGAGNTAANSGNTLQTTLPASTQANQAGAQTNMNQPTPMTAAQTTGTSVNSSGMTLQGALQGGQGQAVNPENQALLLKLQQVLADVRSAVLQESMPGLNTQGGQTAVAQGGYKPAAAGNMAAGTVAGAGTAAALMPDGEQSAGTSPQAQPRPIQGTESWVGRVLKLLGAEHEQQVLRAATGGGQAQSTAPAAGTAPQAAATGANAPAPGGLPGSVPAAAPGNTPAPPQSGDAAGGAVHGGAALAAAGGDKGQPQAALSPAAAALLDGAPDSVMGSSNAHDTLKGLLLKIIAADDLPAPLQEAARQLVHQLTGQQLLLNTDRTSPFAQVTMFLPFIGPDGEQTAAVHIESRRGRKGELDAANCRLWFDLQMKTLGQLMVDVQVSDHKVLLKLYSEQEATGLFLESRQPEIADALEASGYKLLSMKAEMLIQDESTNEESISNNDLGMSHSFAPSPYKGVDYRV
ncbi:Flagellar hook-length control protein FliK [compost metagenome]